MTKKINLAKKLPEGFKTKWLEALRSGKYKQGKRHLRKGDDFCCLGVACDIHRRKTWVLTDEIDMSYETENGVEEMPYSKDLPPRVFAALDQSWDGEPAIETVMDKLASLNDNGKTFKQIAAWIERHL